MQQLNNGPFNGEQVLIFDVQEGCQFCECRIAKEVASSCIELDTFSVSKQFSPNFEPFRTPSNTEVNLVLVHNYYPMNLRETDSTLLFLSKVAEICFIIAIIFAFISLFRAAKDIIEL